MPEHFDMFNQFITKIVEFTPDELTDLNKKCTQVEYPKGSVIMKAGVVCNKRSMENFSTHPK